MQGGRAKIAQDGFDGGGFGNGVGAVEDEPFRGYRSEKDDSQRDEDEDGELVAADIGEGARRQFLAEAERSLG
eukprot:15468990-Alexandrium_andersonii.AAC.1